MFNIFIELVALKLSWGNEIRHIIDYLKNKFFSKIIFKNILDYRDYANGVNFLENFFLKQIFNILKAPEQILCTKIKIKLLIVIVSILSIMVSITKTFCFVIQPGIFQLVYPYPKGLINPNPSNTKKMINLSKILNFYLLKLMHLLRNQSL